MRHREDMDEGSIHNSRRESLLLGANTVETEKLRLGNSGLARAMVGGEVDLKSEHVPHLC